MFDRYLRFAMNVLEIGAGIGTMIERLVDWGAISGKTHLTAIEPDAQNVSAAIERLDRFATAHRYIREPAGKLEFKLAIPDRPLSVDFQNVDLKTYAGTHAGTGRFDLVVAHAVLDLLNIRDALSEILSVAESDSLLYFTLNFDGATILEPEIDPELDRHIEELYHQTMDRRMVNDEPSGDRYTGRRLFQHLRANGVEIIAAGSSDWVVFPGSQGYPFDEEYFLHFIIHTIATALEDHPELDRQRFTEWVEERHSQVERSELVYIAHQIDILGQR